MMLNESKQLPGELAKILERGWKVIPLQSHIQDTEKGGKIPIEKGWKDKGSNDIQQVETWLNSYPDCNWGLLTGKSGITVIDIDNYSKHYSGGGDFLDDLGLTAMATMTPTVRTPNGGYHFYFKQPEGVKIPYGHVGHVGEDFDIPKMVVIPPSVVKAVKTTGQLVAYQWTLITLPELQPIPPQLCEIIAGINTPIPPKNPLRQPLRASENGHNGHNGLHGYVDKVLEGELDKVATAIEGQRNSQLFKSVARVSEFIGQGGLTEGKVSELFELAALTANNKGTPNPLNEIQATIQSGIRKGLQTPKPIPSSSPSLRSMAEPIAQPPRHPPFPEIPVVPQGDKTPSIKDGPRTVPDDLVLQSLSRGEVGDAELLAVMYPEKIIYDHLEKQFYLWWGEHWQADRKQQMGNLLTHKVGEAYQKLAAKIQGEMPKDDGDEDGHQNDKQDLVKTLNKKGQTLYYRNKRKRVIELVSEQPSVAISGTEWGIAPNLLPVANGVIELDTGILWANAPSRYIRYWSDTEYLGLDTPAPRFERFIDEVYAGSEGLADYMQKLLGYACSGYNNEHILPILWGSGGNGKSTLIRAIEATLGHTLAQSASKSLLQSTSDGKPSPDLLKTRNARLVFAHELGNNVKMHEEQLKKLTGGDAHTGRGLYEKDPQTWEYQMTLFLVTNPQPELNALDEALQRRLQLIPHPNSFRGDKADKTLDATLQAERGGILSWLVRGYIRYKREGLNPPDTVKVATEQYWQDQDELALFIDDCLVVGEQCMVKRSDLWREYSDWCRHTRRHRNRKQKELYGYFKNHFDEVKRSDSIYFLGVGLSRDD